MPATFTAAIVPTAVRRMPRDPRPAQPRAPAPLARLRNLGPKSAAMLAQAGIRTEAQLRRLGAVPAYLRLRRHWPAASLNALYALAGAIEDRDWRDVRRDRKLELLTAIEDAERRGPSPAARRGDSGGDDELLSLRNIGPAMRRDFALLGIRTRAQLARRSADALYLRLQQLTQARHDPCVWDTFAAAIHQAKTGEALPWWHFTRERKQRQAEGSFVRAVSAARGMLDTRAGAARTTARTVRVKRPPRR
jgi:predicted flap endonuclease-1-like 5' DNA nuclease